jgi:lauroyl/myristoyl acyltransferase
MDLQPLFISRLGIGLALLLGKSIPAGAAYRIAGLVTALIVSRRMSKIVTAIRANQWVVSQGKLSAHELDRVAQATLSMAGRCIYDFYHAVNRPDEILRRLSLSPELENYMEEFLQGKEGALIVAPHISNFDLAGQALALHGLHYQALAYPRPPGGYQWQNKLRSVNGVEVTPMGKSALRKAKENLKNGGIVITGLDRPLPESRYRPRFFGRPAAMPVAYIHLALQTNVPIIVVACHTKPDGSYVLQTSKKIWMQPRTDLYAATVENAEMVLSIVEEFILQAPEQWSMFYPVWPEVLDETP